MTKSELSWRQSQYAKQYLEHERSFIEVGLRQALGPSVLQVGDHINPLIAQELDPPWWLKTASRLTNDCDLAVDPAFLPFSTDAFATVILPHVLERHSLPHQVLREAHRVLVSDGHIVVTGFNPLSLVGLQRVLRPKAVLNGKYYTSRRVIDWLQLLGFEVVASAMFQYPPLFKSQRLKQAFQFLEPLGDRWLPMFGGGYMITAKKREVGTTLIGRVRFKANNQKLPASVSAQEPLRQLKK